MTGTYGTTKPANINIENDVQILYNYKPNRSYDNDKKFTELPSDNLLKTSDDKNVDINGLYNLKLPLTVFGKKGIYTLYIKPKEISTRIYDVGYLQEFSDVKGLIFEVGNGSALEDYRSENSLVGYRIDYEGGFSRIITSSNLCYAITNNGSTRYKLYVNDGTTTSTFSNLIFCTVTPSASLSHTPTQTMISGVNSESVKIVNTKFNPVMYEIEMVDHDAETLSYMLEGDQVRNLENGTFTIFNHDKQIYKQYNTYTVKTQLGKPLYDIKANKELINSDDNYENTIGLE